MRKGGSTTEIGLNGGLGHLLSGTPNTTYRKLYIPRFRRKGVYIPFGREVVYKGSGRGVPVPGRVGPGVPPSPLPRARALLPPYPGPFPVPYPYPYPRARAYPTPTRAPTRALPGLPRTRTRSIIIYSKIFNSFDSVD